MRESDKEVIPFRCREAEVVFLPHLLRTVQLMRMRKEESCNKRYGAWPLHPPPFPLSCKYSFLTKSNDEPSTDEMGMLSPDWIKMSKFLFIFFCIHKVELFVYHYLEESVLLSLPFKRCCLKGRVFFFVNWRLALFSSHYNVPRNRRPQCLPMPDVYRVSPSPHRWRLPQRKEKHYEAYINQVLCSTAYKSWGMLVTEWLLMK